MGEKVSGSDINEIVAVNFLKQEIMAIKAQASPLQSIELDVQIGSSDFEVMSMISVYQGIQNVVVKLSGKRKNSKYSLLINCHYDTVPVSVGAGDDGTMLSVMLEILRVLSKSDVQLEHSVIFLFNGAEENVLQGSHLFITQHKWANSVKGFINLDSSGNGGRELLFQVTPNSPWLLNYYKKAAPHPYGTTIGEEMFRAKLIPSETDFRIFRDFGNIPGTGIPSFLLILYNEY